MSTQTKALLVFLVVSGWDGEMVGAQTTSALKTSVVSVIYQTASGTGSYSGSQSGFSLQVSYEASMLPSATTTSQTAFQTSTTPISAAQTSSPSPSITPSPSSKHLSIGAKAGITVTVLIVFAVTLACLIILRRLRRRTPRPVVFDDGKMPAWTPPSPTTSQDPTMNRSRSLKVGSLSSIAEDKSPGMEISLVSMPSPSPRSPDPNLRASRFHEVEELGGEERRLSRIAELEGSGVLMELEGTEVTPEPAELEARVGGKTPDFAKWKLDEGRKESKKGGMMKKRMSWLSLS